MKRTITELMHTADFTPEFIRCFPGFRPVPTMIYRVSLEFDDDEPEPDDASRQAAHGVD